MAAPAPSREALRDPPGALLPAVARLLKERGELPVRLFWPDQQGSGVHVNVSGAGVVADSDASVAAQSFIEWLAVGEAQQRVAEANLEYPANPAVATAAEVARWGTFKPNLINVAEAGRLQTTAVKLMDRAGYR